MAGHESRDLDVAGAFRLQLIQLFVIEHDHNAAIIDEAALYFLRFDDVAGLRIHHVLLDGLLVGLVQQTEMHGDILNAGEELHRQLGAGDLDGAFPHCACGHQSLPPCDGSFSSVAVSDCSAWRMIPARVSWSRAFSSRRRAIASCPRLRMRSVILRACSVASSRARNAAHIARSMPSVCASRSASSL